MSRGYFVSPLVFEDDYIPFNRRSMNPQSNSNQCYAAGCTSGGTQYVTFPSPAASVEDAQRALKQAKAAERKARKDAKRKAAGEARATKARRAALATLHDLAEQKKDPYLRLQAAKQLKKWGEQGSVR